MYHGTAVSAACLEAFAWRRLQLRGNCMCGGCHHFGSRTVLMLSQRGLLASVVAFASINVGIFGQLLSVGRPNGRLMACLMPPCQQTYTLWLAVAAFAYVGAVAAHALIQCFRADSADASNAFIYGTIAIAVANVAIDIHYAHPIPHGGVSLNWAMHSDIGTSEQALTPFVSVIVSTITMCLNVLCHRSLADRHARPKRS